MESLILNSVTAPIFQMVVYQALLVVLLTSIPGIGDDSRYSMRSGGRFDAISNCQFLAPPTMHL